VEVADGAIRAKFIIFLKSFHHFRTDIVKAHGLSVLPGDTRPSPFVRPARRGPEPVHDPRGVRLQEKALSYLPFHFLPCLLSSFSSEETARHAVPLLETPEIFHRRPIGKNWLPLTRIEPPAI